MRRIGASCEKVINVNKYIVISSSKILFVLQKVHSNLRFLIRLPFPFAKLIAFPPLDRTRRCDPRILPLLQHLLYLLLQSFLRNLPRLFSFTQPLRGIWFFHVLFKTIEDVHCDFMVLVVGSNFQRTATVMSWRFWRNEELYLLKKYYFSGLTGSFPEQ